MRKLFDELLDFATTLTVLATAADVVQPQAGLYAAGIALGLWASAGWMWLRGAV